MISEGGTFLLAMAFGFSCVQVLASFWGVTQNHPKFLALGRISAFIQWAFLGSSFALLMIAFFICDFSIASVAFHSHTSLPWFYRLAATWGNHEGSLLLFLLILSSVGGAMASFLKTPFLKARALTIQGLLGVLFLLLLLFFANPFQELPFPFSEGRSLNPLLQDRGLWIHPPLLYFGYVGFSAPFSLALAALWGQESGKGWMTLVRPWVLLPWTFLTAGITLGSWWAYYELGWGGWWFWDPVENVSFMPWLSSTALLHSLLTKRFYGWSLFLSLLTFSLSLLGTFLIRSGLLISVHSFAQNSNQTLLSLSLFGILIGLSFCLWVWKVPRFQNPAFLNLFSRQGLLLLNTLLISIGLFTVALGTLYPLGSELLGGEKVAVGAPYFERTFIPLIIPLLILIPLGTFLREEKSSLFPLLIGPLTATLGSAVLILYVFFPLSLGSFTGIVVAIWILGGTLQGFCKKRLSFGPSLAHFGVAISLLGVSVGSGFRIDKTQILKPHESLEIGGTSLTLQRVTMGKTSNYLYEKAHLSYQGHLLSPEKRVYHPQNTLLSETAIQTNGLRDFYVLLGPYQGENQWLIRASYIPLAPWIWVGGALMFLGAFLSFFKRKETFLLCLLALSSPSWATSSLETKADSLYQEVRCPVCFGQSLKDSDTQESKILKAFILKNLKDGKSEAEIRENLRTLYGDDILFYPPFKGHHLLLWGAPFLLFFGILGGFLWKTRHSQLKKKS